MPVLRQGGVAASRGAQAGGWGGALIAPLLGRDKKPLPLLDKQGSDGCGTHS